MCRVDESWGVREAERFFFVASKRTRALHVVMQVIINHTPSGPTYHPHFLKRQVRINMKHSIRFGTKIHISWRVCAWLVLMMLMMMMRMMRMTLKRLMPKMTTTLEVRINMKYSVRFGTKYFFFPGVSFLGLC